MSEADEKFSTYKALSDNSSWAETLKEALEVEEKGRKECQEKGFQYLGWEWHAVHQSPGTLNAMVAAKLLDVAFSSRSATHYKIHNPELVREALAMLTRAPAAQEATIPDDLFSSIVGNDDIKAIVRMAIEAEKP